MNSREFATENGTRAIPVWRNAGGGPGGFICVDGTFAGIRRESYFTCWTASHKYRPAV